MTIEENARRTAGTGGSPRMGETLPNPSYRSIEAPHSESLGRGIVVALDRDDDPSMKNTRTYTVTGTVGGTPHSLTCDAFDSETAARRWRDAALDGDLGTVVQTWTRQRTLAVDAFWHGYGDRTLVAWYVVSPSGVEFGGRPSDD